MNKFKDKIFGSTKPQSYSQSGEDLIIDYVLKNNLSVVQPNYLDIGANHPSHFSNTYKFYMNGSRGVLIEPDPELAKKLKQVRPLDCVLEKGVGRKRETSDFYLMNPHTLNTFSSKEVELYKKFYPETTQRGKIRVDIVLINDILKDYFSEGLDVLSIDVEGLDRVIIESLDFNRYRPKLICIESIIYNKDKTWTKANAIRDYLNEKKYFIYADTFINTIYIDSFLWKEKGQPDLVNFKGF